MTNSNSISKKSLEKKSVYVVIVTLNAEQWIEKCLSSIQNSSYPATTIVIDNGSTDKTLSIVDRFPEAICQRLGKNLGFGVANNIGIMQSLKQNADFVFLLNSDAYISQDTFEKLMEAFKKYPEYGILSPIHLTYKGDAIDKLFEKYLSKNPEFISNIYFNKTQPIYPINFINAAGWLLAKRVIDTVGGFDPIFTPIYGEDDDYCNRTIFHGFKIGIVPSAEIYHGRGGGTGQNKDKWQSMEKLVLRKTNLWTVWAKDIRYSWKSRIRKILYDFSIEVNRSLIYLQYRNLIVIFRSGYKILRRMPLIWKSRAKLARPGKHFLDTESMKL